MPKVDYALLAGVLAPALAGDAAPLVAFLKAHSNLPGPRGNLELAWQVADAVAALAPGPEGEAAWAVAEGLAGVTARQAPTGDPGEFLAFCGALAAARYAAQPARRARVWGIIAGAAEDERWRLREAAAQAIQRALPLDRPGGLAVLGEWAARGSWLLCRAVAAGLADPPLLRDPLLAGEALRLHETIVARLAAASDRKAVDFRVLRQGLGYTVSVVVAAAPEPGFAWLRRLAAIPDADLAWVLRSNLGKGRLARAFPRETAEVRALLAG